MLALYEAPWSDSGTMIYVCLTLFAILAAHDLGVSLRDNPFWKLQLI